MKIHTQGKDYKKNIDGIDVVLTTLPVYENAIYRNDGIFLGEGKEQIFVPYEDIALELTNPVTVKVKYCRDAGAWYYGMDGSEHVVEGVNKGRTVPYNDYITAEGKLLNFTDCSLVE